MKWIIVCFLTITIYAQDTVMVAKKDEFTGFTWFKPYDYTPRFTGLYVYFGLTEDSLLTSLRVKFHYYGQNWIFFDKVIVLTNGNTYNFSFYRLDGSTNVSSGVFEVFDFGTDQITDLDEMIKDVVVSGKAKVRFYGKYKRDFELQPFQIALIKKYSDGYSKLEQKLSPPDPVIDRPDTNVSYVPEKVVEEDSSDLIKYIFFILAVGLVLSVFIGHLRRNREIERKMEVGNKDKENSDSQ